MKHKTHYTDEYFKWQSSLADFGGWANVDKFIKYISKEDKVLDFGCGGGFLLDNLNCKEKKGIEINESAIANAKGLGLDVYKTADDIPDEWADVIISNNALEHTPLPLNELKNLRRILKKGGKFICVVPCESISYKYKPNDINYHLYSWSPMCLGNLFNEAGYHVIESKAYKHKWPPKYRLIAKLFGRRIFNLACRIYAQIETTWFQVRVVATK